MKDTKVNEFTGFFVDWHLKLWGESIDASKAKLLPMPSDSDDDKHDVISTTTIAGTTTTVAPVAGTSLVANPTDHPDRPIKPPASDTDHETTPTGTSAPNATSTSSWLPSFFPTFGVSSKTQVWIYGAAALIAAFCSGLAVYLYLARRKRLRNSAHDSYAFDIIDDDETEGLNGSGRMNRGQGRKGGKRRAGELYDAFAAGSEDEDDEYTDDEGGDDREKALFDSDGSDQHVIGGDEDDSDSESDSESDIEGVHDATNQQGNPIHE